MPPGHVDARPKRWRLITAIALPLIAVIVIVLLGRYVADQVANDPAEPLAVGIVPQPGSTSAGCVALDAALPAELDGRARRTMAVAEPGVAGWGSPAVVLRCGITDPAELTCTAQLTAYNGVTWLELDSADLTTYIAVDRSSRVALTVDNSAGVGAVQALSNIIETVMPARAICAGGVLNPVDTP